MKRSVRMALALILCMVSFVGCGLNSKIDIMFSKVGLDASLDDVIESYGESDEIKKDDITGNTVYSYPCDYSGQDVCETLRRYGNGGTPIIHAKDSCFTVDRLIIAYFKFDTSHRRLF